jgi:hypothetical protein
MATYMSHRFSLSVELIVRLVYLAIRIVAA